MRIKKPHEFLVTKARCEVNTARRLHLFVSPLSLTRVLGTGPRRVADPQVSCGLPVSQFRRPGEIVYSTRPTQLSTANAPWSLVLLLDRAWPSLRDPGSRLQAPGWPLATHSGRQAGHRSRRAPELVTGRNSVATRLSPSYSFLIKCASTTASASASVTRRSKLTGSRRRVFTFPLHLSPGCRYRSFASSQEPGEICGDERTRSAR